MNYEERNHPIHGKCLFVDNGIIEIGIPLDFGLRITHFSFIGSNNIFFEQPKDMTTFTTDNGWRIRGGHRIWIAPECEADYCPDNAPITYKITDQSIIITQQPDPWLNVIKEMELSMDNNRVTVINRITNTAKTSNTFAVWAITAVAAGGKQTIRFQRRDNGMDPWHRVSMWDYTNLGDIRASYTRDDIVITHMPIDERYKIGVAHPYGPVTYENGDTVFLKHFQIQPALTYPDGNVSYETFCSRYMMEMESLSPLYEVQPNETVSHTEVWELIDKS